MAVFPIKNIQLVKLFLLFLFALISYLLSSVYRPYIYLNNINDLGIADMGNNLFFIPGSWLLFCFIMPNSMKTYEDNKMWIFCSFFVLSIVEILSMKYHIFGCFDLKDIFALLFGALIALYLNKKLES